MMQIIAVLTIVGIHVGASAMWWGMGNDTMSMMAAVSVAFTLWLGGVVADRMTYRK